MQGIIAFLKLYFSYLTMLSVMTYNVGILLAVVAGLSSAYFILGFQPTKVRVSHNYFLQQRSEKNELS